MSLSPKGNLLTQQVDLYFQFNNYSVGTNLMLTLYFALIINMCHYQYFSVLHVKCTKNYSLVELKINLILS